jgi:sugar/nucleoside kinase (ribokinase family)
MSKILVIGHSVLDRIYFNEKYSERPGGIFHSVNTLANIINSDDEIFLLTQFSESTFKHFKKIYNQVNLHYSESVREIPVVELHLFSDKEREEKYSNVNQSIKISREINLKIFDVIYINMISGFDITVSDLDYLRKESNAKIYFDLHTLARGFDENGNRNFRTVPNIGKWLKNIDILQMNENEKYFLTGSWNEEKDLKRLFELGIKAVIITEGGKGVNLYTDAEHIKIPALKVEANNFVGCGDSFGAAFCYRISMNNSLISALEFANFVAGTVTTYNSQDEYKNLRRDVGEKNNQK